MSEDCFLLFKGSSTEEIDYKRHFRAEEWARFCGRYSCAEVIEKCSRTRLINLDACKKRMIKTEEGAKFMQKSRSRANSIVSANMDGVKQSNESGKIILRIGDRRVRIILVFT